MMTAAGLKSPDRRVYREFRYSWERPGGITGSAIIPRLDIKLNIDVKMENASSPALPSEVLVTAWPRVARGSARCAAASEDS